MSALIRLYPRPWRERYETEFLAVLASRPPSIGDRVDIVRGAVDARLHPELSADADGRRGLTPPERIAAGASLAAGALWLAWFGLIVRDFRGWDAGEPENAALGVALSAFAGLALAVAHVFVAYAAQGVMHPVGGVGASIAAVAFVFTAFGGGATAYFALIGSAMLAGSLAGRGLPAALAIGWAASALLVLGVFVAFVAGQGRDVSWLPLGLLYGVAWVGVGAVLGLRGVPRPAAETPASDHETTAVL